MILKIKLTSVAILLLAMVSCNTKQQNSESSAEKVDSVSTASIEKAPFGTMPDGQQVSIYTVTNKNGLEMRVMNYGGIIVSLKTPDRNGKSEDIVLGYDSLSSYIKANPYFGAIVGRFGNRIANGKFTLDGKEYKLAVNDGKNHLHGGIKGFDKVFWNIEEMDGQSLKLTYSSKDGEEGYPGNLDVEVIYSLTDNNELKLDYKATTDKKTVINVTQHTYFNLTGNPANDILNHTLILNADKFLPVDKTLIPTGELKSVTNTPFDFTTAHKIGERINNENTQLAYGTGYDHCWILNNDNKLDNLAASAYDSTSGRFMEVFTTEPAIQFYSGNFLDGKNIGKGGVAYQQRSAFCLETQHYPDAPNKASFPSVVLDSGATYATTTVYKFSTK